MALTFRLETISSPNTAFTISVAGDGSSSSINIPLGMLPISIPVGRKENNPVAMEFGVNTSGFTGTATLSPDGQVIALTISPAPPSGTKVDVAFILFYGGI
jgi:hypothetical protein